MSQQHKMIKCADCSEYGSDVVQEYQEDRLAADSDNEKRNATAEKAAERRVGKRKQAAKQRRQRWPQTPSQAGSALGLETGLAQMCPTGPVALSCSVPLSSTGGEWASAYQLPGRWYQCSP